MSHGMDIDMRFFLTPLGVFPFALIKMILNYVLLVSLSGEECTARANHFSLRLLESHYISMYITPEGWQGYVLLKIILM